MSITFPNVRVEVTLFEGFSPLYSLFINNVYEGTYQTKEDLQFRILLIINTELNKGLSEKE